MLSAKVAEMLQGLCEEIVIASSQTDQQRRDGLRSGSVTPTGYLQYITHKWPKKKI